MLIEKGRLRWKKVSLGTLMHWFKLICVLLVIFDITTTVVFSVMAMKENSHDMIGRTKSQISEYIKSVWNLGDAIAAAPSTRDTTLSLRQRAQMLIPYADAYDLFMLGITNEKGLLGSTLDRSAITSDEMLNDEGVGDLSSRPAFQEMMATGESILTDTYQAGADGSTLIYTIWIPYYGEEKIAGAITVSIKFEFIQDIIVSKLLEDSYYFTLFDSQNNISANPDEDMVGQSLDEAYGVSKWASISVDELAENLNSGKSGDYWGINNGRLEYVNYMSVDGTPWKLVMRTDFFGSFKNTFYSLAIKLAVYLSLMLLFSLKKNRDIITREHLFNMMTGNVNEVFLAYNLDCRKLMYVSSNSGRVLGIEADNWLENPEGTASIFNKFLGEIDENTGENAYYVDEELLNVRTGERHPYRFRVYKIAEDGERWAILVITDEMEEQEKKRVLEKALLAAEQASRAKSEFLTSMSHDIRTPMNAIVGMAIIASANLDDRDKVKECLDKVSISSRHLLGLINSVLDMSKIESGKLTVKEEKFDLVCQLQELYDMFRVQAEDSRVNLTLVMGEVYHPYVVGDVLHFSQIVINLVTNALKFTDAGGEAVILAEEVMGSKQNSSLYRICISDNGIGIPSEFLEQMFEPFERAERSTISKIEGSGLGLAIVKQLVDLMNGTIQVESKPGKGSKFTVEVPLKWEEFTERTAGKTDGWQNGQSEMKDPCRGELLVDATDSSKELTESVSYSGRRILLVEDNELNMEIARTLLEMMGVTVEPSWNGKEALNIFKESPEHYFDMVITDIQMPLMDGYEETLAIRMLERTDAGQVPIIAMTADAFAEAKQKAREAGMNGYITKPIELSQLRAVLEEWLVV